MKNQCLKSSCCTRGYDHNGRCVLKRKLDIESPVQVVVPSSKPKPKVDRYMEMVGIEGLWKVVDEYLQPINQEQVCLLENARLDTEREIEKDGKRAEMVPNGLKQRLLHQFDGSDDIPVEEWHPSHWGKWKRSEKLDVHVHPGSVQSLVKGREVGEKRNEIDDKLEQLETAYTNVLHANVHHLRKINGLAKSEVAMQPILDYDMRLANQLQRYYQVLFPNMNSRLDASSRIFRLRATARDILTHFTQNANEQSASIITNATRFALTLQYGDKVDALDRNGVWSPGIVIEAQQEANVLVRYVKIHYTQWSSAYDEWISTFAGRILPCGMGSANAKLNTAM